MLQNKTYFIVGAKAKLSVEPREAKTRYFLTRPLQLAGAGVAVAVDSLKTLVSLAANLPLVLVTIKHH